MDRMDLNTVNAGLSQFFGCLAESLYHLADLGYGERTGGDTLRPAVRRLGSGGADILYIHNGACQLIKHVAFGKRGHPAVYRHGAAHTGSQLDKQLCACLMELYHVLLELFEHLVVLIQPLSAGDAQRVTDALHTGQDQTNAVLRPVKQEVCRLLIEVVRLHPAEQGGTAHGTLDDAVFYFHIPDLPWSKQSIIFFVHVISPFVFIKRRRILTVRQPLFTEHIALSAKATLLCIYFNTRERESK